MSRAWCYLFADTQVLAERWALLAEGVPPDREAARLYLSVISTTGHGTEKERFARAKHALDRIAQGLPAVPEIREALIRETILHRGVYENPGGAILYYAHRELEYLCLDRATYHYKEGVAIRFGELVYDGMWFCQLREALQAFVDSTQESVTGTVRLKLYKGNIISAGSKSPYSLYSQEFVTFERDEVYDQSDATGFINLFGLPLKVRALMQEKAGKK